MKKTVAFIMSFIICFSVFAVPSFANDISTAKIYEWKQTDSRWDKIYDKDWSYGCAVTAIAVQIARTDLVRVDEKAKTYDSKTKKGFNPGTFAKAMELGNQLSVGDYDVSGTIPGFKVATDSKYHKPSSIKFNYYPAKSKQDIVDAMKYFLDKGYYPVIEGPGSSFPDKWNSRHYVAVVEVTDNDVKVVDPAYGIKCSLFKVSVGPGWSYQNIEKCGNPDGYGCCRLYKVDSSKLLVNDYYSLSAEDYISYCSAVPTYCTLKANLSKAEYIKTMPCSVQTNPNSQAIRAMKNGEYYTAVGIIKNSENNYWYKIDLGNGEYGYIYGGTAEYVETIEEDPVFKDAEFSKTTYGKGFPMPGTISTSHTRISKVAAEIKDSSGKTLKASEDWKKTSYKISGSNVDNNLKFAKLAKGNATITFTIELTVFYCTDGKTMKSLKYTKTHSWDFKVS